MFLIIVLHFTQPHHSPSLSNSLLEKWCLPSVMIWRCRCVSLHQSTGSTHDHDVIVLHNQNILQMNKCSWFISETVCRGKLYNICGRSMLCTLPTAKPTWQKQGVKMKDFKNLPPKRVCIQLAGNAMKSYHNSWGPRIIYDNEHWHAQGDSISSRLLHNLTD